MLVRKPEYANQIGTPPDPVTDPARVTKPTASRCPLGEDNKCDKCATSPIPSPIRPLGGLTVPVTCRW